MIARQQFGNTAALGSNVIASVALIFANKWLMGNTIGFRYATTLCALHYISSSLFTWTCVILGFTKRVTMPRLAIIAFAAAANTSVVSLNMSLMLNKVGFYQIAKLTIVPFVCLLERFWLGKRLSSKAIAAIATVLVGVAIVTLTDLEMADNFLGFSVAAVSVVTSALQQVLCREIQKNHNISAVEALSNTAPAQGFSLLLVGPFLDYHLMHSSVLNYIWTSTAAATLFISCSLSVGVNLTQYISLGRVSAVTYQVAGHSKTILILLGSSIFLGEVITPRQGAGMVIAVAGMVAYNYITSECAPTACIRFAIYLQSLPRIVP